ncbi:tetratricopeptide repeat protein [Burkholderia alba]|uniref:tetratricopeptide repeat protein n=1 Tax=Burkholderia alba TaxID=2683677 RepID=UPI002B059C81|nr:tetratricopeptide repeat protein [Burkholderia alba]
MVFEAGRGLPREAAVDSVLGSARAFHQRGALAEAERGYREALRIDPDHADAWHLLGVLHFQHGRMDDADAAMRRAIERTPSALSLSNHASVLIGLGRRDEALARTDAALALNPAHPRALLLRAGILADLGRHGEAVDGYARLIDVAPTAIDAWWRRGDALRVLGRHDEALACADRALSIDGRAFDAHRLRAHALRDLGRLDDALDSYGHALAISPGHAETLLMQGLAFAELGRLAPALASLNDAIASQPDSVDALYNSAVVLERLGRYGDALGRCDRALRIAPLHAAAHANRGNALHGLARHAEALDSFDRALEIAPASLETRCNRSQTLVVLRRYDDALDGCDRALALDDGYAPAWFARGKILQRLHRYDEALASHDRALALDPANAFVLFQRADTLRALRRHDEALAGYDRVLDIDPDDIAAHFTKAFVYLQTGRFEAGWPEYEWRWRERQVGAHRRTFAQPLWLGDAPLDGRTILLHAEQGLGDTLQFCRYAEQVKARGARVVLEVQGTLKALLGSVPGVDQVVAAGEPLPPFDVHCPLLSLPLAFRTDFASIPREVPYLRAEPARVAQWRVRLGERRRPRIGIAWSGNPNHLDDHNRSIALDRLLPMLADSIEWISIQKVVRDDERPLLDASPIRHFGDEIRDFADTAALLQTLDGVVSVDTSVAHLAGALGRPLWLMLPYLPDWRWLLDRDDTPWYPAARLVRQTRAGDWHDVLARIGAALPSPAAA